MLNEEMEGNVCFPAKGQTRALQTVSYGPGSWVLFLLLLLAQAIASRGQGQSWNLLLAFRPCLNTLVAPLLWEQTGRVGTFE